MQPDMVAGSDTQRAGHDAVEVTHGLLRLAKAVFDFGHVGEQGWTGLRELGFPSEAIKERCPERLFQDSNALADRWLAKVQSLGCRRERPTGGDFCEGAQVGKIHV